MNIKLIIKFALFSFLILFLNGCATGKLGKSKPFKHNTPLIKDDVRKSGKIEVQKTVDMGPKPTEGDTTKLEKRKKTEFIKIGRHFHFPTFSKKQQHCPQLSDIFLNLLVLYIPIY